MTEKSCSVQTSEQRRFLEIREAAERSMLDKVFKAIDGAAVEVAEKLYAYFSGEGAPG